MIAKSRKRPIRLRWRVWVGTRKRYRTPVQLGKKKNDGGKLECREGLADVALYGM